MVSSENISAALAELNREGINPYDTYDGAAPIVGTYAGFEVGPSAGWAPGVNVVRYTGFDRTTGTWFEATFLGTTASLGWSPGAGPIGGSVEGGTFAYTGSIDQFAGLSIGFETSAPVQAGVSLSLFTGGENWGVMAYGGVESAVEVEIGAGWTYVNQPDNRAILEEAFSGMQHVQVIPSENGFDVIQWGAVTSTGQANLNWPISTWHYRVENVNGVEVIVQDGVTVHENPMIVQCFGVGTPIDMWPLDPSIKPDSDGLYDEAVVRANIWQKPIEEITPDDWVLSFDKKGNLQPGKVTRTFTKDVKIVLDFFGTGVTPGHVYFRADSKKAHKFETLIDILRDDGVIANAEGQHIRAATGLPIDDPRDGFVWAVAGNMAEDGRGLSVREKRRIRLGTRFIIDDGRDFCIDDLIRVAGGTVTEDGMIRIGDAQMPFHWTFSDALPKPETYVLQRSGVTLEEIYAANEWEDMRPMLPSPAAEGASLTPETGTKFH